jgi:hypothetical protein
MGILSVLNTEILAGSDVNIEIHSRGLAKMLRHRGGFKSLQGSQSTDLFVTFLLAMPAGKALSSLSAAETRGKIGKPSLDDGSRS